MELLDFIFPKRCIECGKLGAYFCKNCLKNLEFFQKSICPSCLKFSVSGMTHPKCRGKFSLDGLTCIFSYRGIIKKAIKQIKYRFVFNISSELIELIPEGILTFFKSDIFRKSYILPVPLHKERMKYRGFNQSEKLAKIFAEKIKIEISPEILIRDKNTVPQSDLTLNERIKNIRGAFKINKSDKDFTAGNKFILFDDIWTTGLTMKNCARILKANGAEFVWGLALSHG